ncbi:hypothetical protein ZIOFF_060941 [Zingiber officinale]|uniref:Uncharacterized protein n=1 Tax=Zingiber officinale TaxID=94328 RepID=A0A8J5FF63_ZINOF|nr:hypothetical protein ZIOFF_060941 [Zingiber officinale]
MDPTTTKFFTDPKSTRGKNDNLDGWIYCSLISGYQATKNSTTRRMSNFDTEGIQNEGEEEFAGVFIETNPSNRWEALGEPDTNPRWDTLGEPSGRYNFYVNYAAPPPAPFIPPTRSMWDDDDDQSTDAAETKVITEVVLPSIWEDTPWEEDPYLDIYGFEEEENHIPNEHESHITEEDYEEDEEDLSVHFLGLENLDIDYPISPNTVLLDEQQQNIVEQVEHMEDQYFEAQATRRMGELSIQESSSTENEDDTEQQDVTNEIAHAGIEVPLMEQLEGLEYPILRSMMNQAVNENAFSSTSAISRSIAQLVFEKIMTPPVIEVNDLRQTVRGTGSFGSTEMEESRTWCNSSIIAVRKFQAKASLDQALLSGHYMNFFISEYIITSRSGCSANR